MTSVGLSVPGLLYTVSGSPITGSGTLTFSLKTQAKGTFLSGPVSGADATPTMRAIVPADLPVMIASGASHAAGIVPDPGSTAGTTKYLREDGTWQVPPGTSSVTGSGSSSGVADTIPSLTNFSWAVQNGAVATQQSHGISIRKAAGPAQSSLIAPVSGSSWTATARLRSTLPNNGAYGIGLCRYDSASGKLVGFLYILGSSYTLQLLNYSTPTTFSATVSNGYSSIQILEWMRIRSDGTNIYYELSSDGAAWSTIYTTAISGGYLPATTGCGVFMATSATATDPALVASLHSWQVA